MVISGFLVEELETGEIILWPRGMGDTMLRIRCSGDTWNVVEARGAYGGFARGRKREFFETHLDRWWKEAQAQQAQ